MNKAATWKRGTACEPGRVHCGGLVNGYKRAAAGENQGRTSLRGWLIQARWLKTLSTLQPMTEQPMSLNSWILRPE